MSEILRRMNITALITSDFPYRPKSGCNVLFSSLFSTFHDGTRRVIRWDLYE